MSTLPTTRIDTLSPPNGAPDGGSPASHDSVQQIRLMDFPSTNNHQQNGIGGSSSGNGTPTSHLFSGGANYHTIPTQVQPVMPVTNNHNHHHNFNNDLSNFTLVNLSNQNDNEGEEEGNEEEESPMIPQPQYHKKRNSINYLPTTKRGSFSSYQIPATAMMGGGGNNHGGGKLSSSLSSSSEDSDTGFLVPHRNHNGGPRVRGNKEACQYRLQKQNVPSSPLMSPDRVVGSTFQQGNNRKRLKRC